MSSDRKFRRVGHPTGGEALTNQSDAAGTDINVIVAQYKKNGTMPNVYVGDPLWGDFTAPDDLQSCYERWQGAVDKFNELPASVRNASNNDPVTFLRMFDDPDQRALLEGAGLIVDQEPNEANQPIPNSTSEGVAPGNEVTERSSPPEGGSGGSLPPVPESSGV